MKDICKNVPIQSKPDYKLWELFHINSTISQKTLIGLHSQNIFFDGGEDFLPAKESVRNNLFKLFRTLSLFELSCDQVR